MPQANRACQRCEIRHYAPVSHGRTSLSGCQGDALVMAGAVPTPAGPDPAQPCLSSWVHLQVRGGITAPPRLDFRHLPQIKHSVRAPWPFQPLERGTESLGCLPGGAQRAGGARSWRPNPAPCCATPPRQADLPLLLQPLPSLSCPVQPLQSKLLLTFKGRDPSLFWFWER